LQCHSSFTCIALTFRVVSLYAPGEANLKFAVRWIMWTPSHNLSSEPVGLAQTPLASE